MAELPSWDSALVDPRGKPRPAYAVVKSFVRKFAREAKRRAALRQAEGERVRGALVAAAVLVAAVALTGCKSLENVARGGKVVGDTLTVYSLLPQPGSGNARDLVDAEKLALYEAGGMAGEFAVNFVSIDEGQAVGSGAARRAGRPAGHGADRPLQLERRDEDGAAVQRGRRARGDAGRRLRRVHRDRAPRRARALAALRAPHVARLQATTSCRRAPCSPRRGSSRAARTRGSRSSRSRARWPTARGRAARGGARTVGDPSRADAVIFAGDDADNAAGVADALAEEAPGTPVVLPDALTFAGIERQLSRAARRQAMPDDERPEAGLDPELRDFENASASATSATPARTRSSATGRCGRARRDHRRRATAPAIGRR